MTYLAQLAFTHRLEAGSSHMEDHFHLLQANAESEARAAAETLATLWAQNAGAGWRFSALVALTPLEVNEHSTFITATWVDADPVQREQFLQATKNQLP